MWWSLRFCNRLGSSHSNRIYELYIHRELDALSEIAERLQSDKFAEIPRKYANIFVMNIG